MTERFHSLLLEILRAERRIRPHILETPLPASLPLRKESDATVYLKMESEQHTGSFKARGAINKILSMTDQERARGVVTASTGNHARGVAYALALTGTPGTIFMPASADPAKVEALSGYPVDLALHEGDALATELHGRRVAEESGRVWISPYNDAQIIGGQGTISLELIRQLKHFDDVFVTVGGGGLISGIAVYLKAVAPETRIIGCLPERSPDMFRAVQAGRILALPQQETLSDGSAGGVEPGSITFPVCQTLVDEYILVSEDEIRSAIRLMVEQSHRIVEGAAGVAIAAFLKRREQFRGRTVVIVVCGGNLSTQKLRAVLG